MKISLASLLLTLFSLSLCDDQLHINTPNSLISWYTSQYDSDLKTEILPFGNVPWGRKIQGWLVMANPSDACDPIEFVNEPRDDNYIVVAQRQNCDLYIKAQNAEKAGAKLLIIVDTNTAKGFGIEQVKLPPSTMEPIDIPILGITKTVGDRLIHDLNVGNSDISDISVMLDFSIIRDRLMSYNVFLSIADRESLGFLRKWAPYYKILAQGYARFSPTFVYERIEGKEEECLCGSFCVPQGYKDVPASEMEIGKENLRQICMFNELGWPLWLKYALAYEQFCLDETDLGDCSSRIMKALDLDANKVNSCVSQNFMNSTDYICSEVLQDSHYGTYGQVNFLRVYPLRYKNLPSLSMQNRREIQNLSPPESIFAAFCETLAETPDGCNGVYDTTTINPDPHRVHPLPPEPPLQIDIGLRPKPREGQPRPEGEPEAEDENMPESGTTVGLCPPPSPISAVYIVLLVVLTFAVGFFFGRRYAKRQQQYQTLEEVKQNSAI